MEKHNKCIQLNEVELLLRRHADSLLDNTHCDWSSDWGDGWLDVDEDDDDCDD